MDLKTSITKIPELVRGIESINTLIKKLSFSADAEDKILDGTKLILPDKIEITEKVVIKEEDKEIPAPDGIYKFEDRKEIITVKNGVIKDIKKVDAAEHQVTDVRTTEGMILRYDAETPTIGLDIFVVKDTGQEPAPDGEFILEDGTTITVQSGKITNVSEKPAEEAAKEGDEEKMAKVKELIGQLKELGVTVETMKTENEEIKKENKEIKKEHEVNKEIMKRMFKIVETLADLPADKSNATKATFDSDDEPVDIVADLAEYHADIKKLRTGQN